jgi:hypothetical protein
MAQLSKKIRRCAAENLRKTGEEAFVEPFHLTVSLDN